MRRRPNAAFYFPSAVADASIADKERRTWLRSVVYQKSGSVARRKVPYRAVASLGSRTATTPRSPVARTSRPAPWAISSAACVAATAMKPFPPCSSTDFCRALISGSSGRGKGIRSITTS